MGRIWLFGDDIDTDQIVPGRYAPYMTGESPVKYAFIEYRPEFAGSVQPGDVLVAGDNFGCGSSREYATEALVGCGLSAIIARSFARIFQRNAVNLGLPIFEAPLADVVPDGAEAEFSLEAGTLVVNGQTHHLPPIPEFQREIIAAGGLIPYIRQHGRFPGTRALQGLGIAR
ncbi:MAG TPA: homoaconitate hydratase [Chloroflexota bacterium]|nr:homoaconitate hydratase [Chloroflexota bacterium]